jgi:hypothetical protein
MLRKKEVARVQGKVDFPGHGKNKRKELSRERSRGLGWSHPQPCKGELKR